MSDFTGDKTSSRAWRLPDQMKRSALAPSRPQLICFSGTEILKVPAPLWHPPLFLMLSVFIRLQSFQSSSVGECIGSVYHLEIGTPRY